MIFMKKVFDSFENARERDNNATPFNNEVRKIKGLVYKTVDGVDYKIDLILPKNPPEEGKKYPFIYFIPGGGWLTGRNYLRYGIATLFATMGAAVALVNHRISPKYLFPAHIIDVAEGFNFTKTLAEEYSFDTDNVFIGGDSSGGHLAACLGIAASDESYVKKLGLPKLEMQPKKAVLLCGAYSFDTMYRLPFAHTLIVRHVSGTLSRGEFRKDYRFYKEVNPYYYLNEKFPESLIVGGKNDFLCPHEAQNMAENLTKVGVKNTLVIGNNFFNSGHDYILRINFAPARGDMLKIMEWYLEKQKEVGVDLSEGFSRVKFFLENRDACLQGKLNV